MSTLDRHVRLLAVGLSVAVGLVGCSSKRTEEAKGESHRSLVPHSEGAGSIEALSDRSDVIARGTVVAIDEGRTVGDDDAHSLEYNRVTVDVETIYWSRDGEGPSEVVLEQPAGSAGEAVDYAGLSPNVEGDEMLLFLKEVPAAMNAPGDLTYTITAGLGRFDIADDGSFDGPDADAPVVDAIEGMSVNELEAALDEATP